MKNLIFLSLFSVAVIALFSFNTIPNTTANSSTETEQLSIPSDQRILANINNPRVKIIGKLKVSEYEYRIYVFKSDDNDASFYRMIRLDNGVWLFDNPGWKTWVMR